MVCSFSFKLFIHHYLCWSFGSYNICVNRSDPTENDSVEGLRPNARGPGLVTFGVCLF